MLKTPDAKSPEDMGMVLASMGLAMQHQFLQEKCAMGQEEWMDALRLGGGFDVANDRGYDQGGLQEMHALVEGVLGFMDNLNHRYVTEDPVYGVIEPLEVCEVAMPAPFASAYTRLVDHFLDTEEKRMAEPKTVLQNAIPIAPLYARLTMGAVALDLPDVVAKLGKRSPEAMGQWIPFDLLGKNTKINKEHVSGVAHTVYGVALLLSRKACMDAIVQCSPDPDRVVSQMTNTRLATSSAPLLAILDAPDRHFYPISFEKALKHAWNESMPDGERQTHFSAALDALKPMPTSAHKNAMVPAYLNAGVYDVHPALSVAHALEHGHAQIVRHFAGRIPWSEIPFDDEKKSPMMACLINAQDNPRQRDHEEAMLAVIDLAVAEGQGARVLTSFATPLYTDLDTEPKKNAANEVTNLVDPHNDNGLWGPVQVEPLTRILNMDFNRALVKMLEQGLDPGAPASSVPGTWTPLQIAQAVPTSGLPILRSFQARAKSYALLQDMDASPSHAPAP